METDAKLMENGWTWMEIDGHLKEHGWKFDGNHTEHSQFSSEFKWKTLEDQDGLCERHFQLGTHRRSATFVLQSRCVDIIP